MSVTKTVLKNVASSWMGLGVQILVTFLLTPIVLSRLGTDIYGVWLLLQGMVGYYGLVDMGLRAGITQSITNRIAANDYAAVRLHISVSRPLLLGISAAIFVAALLLSWLLPVIIETSPEFHAAFAAVVIIQGLGVALQIPLMPYSAVLVGLQRYDVANSIVVLSRIVYAVSAYFVLVSGGGIIALSITMVVANLGGALLKFAAANFLAPEIRGSADGNRRDEIGELFKFGIWNLMIQVGRKVIYYSDVLVVGVLFTSGAIVPYGLAGAIVEYCNTLVKISTRVLYPTMTNLQVNGEQQQQRTLYVLSTRICMIVSLAFLVIGYGHVQPFLLLWLASSDDKEIIAEQAPTLFLLIGSAFAFVSFRRPGTQLLLANKKLKELAIVQFSEAAFNLAISFALGWWIGVQGVALGTLIPAVGLGLAWHLTAHAKILETNWLNLLSELVPTTLLFSTALALAALILHRFIGPIESWISLITSVSIHMAVTAVLLPLGLCASERRSVAQTLRNRRNRTDDKSSRSKKKQAKKMGAKA